MFNYKSRLSKNISAQLQIWVVGKYICSITNLGCRKIYLSILCSDIITVTTLIYSITNQGCRKIYLIIPCPSQTNVVTENISAQLQFQVAEKYIWAFHVHRMSRQLRKIYMCPSQIKVVTENISGNHMSIVCPGGYGKLTCSITILCCRNISVPSIVDQCSYGKYICSIHVHRGSRLLRKIYLLNYNSRLSKKYTC